MNEAETRAELIDPAIREAGWGVVEGSRVAREHEISMGRLHGHGGPRPRARGDIADYVLIYRDQKLAVVEAKKRDAEVTEGLGQAKQYASKLEAPYAFSTNGRGLYRVDMRNGDEGDVEPVAYPSPDELWQAVFESAGETNAAGRWREKFGAVPYEDRSGMWQPRYYQHNAIKHVLESIAKGDDRILLTMATGTGKTAVAFQIVWKLFHARWSLANRQDPDAQTGRPRVLFLADRNILANQAFNSFGAFEDKALIRIDPQSIRKKGGVPTNGSVFFTIFQTFMTPGKSDDAEFAFGELPPDFFDFVIIDECHRGGANDESNWRGILDYFSPAVQLGLTATPRRDVNADTYKYFGDPVYTYSLKEGINDGYLTPFKVRQVQTTLDEYVYTSDDSVDEGEIEQGKRYVEEDFNRIIEIKAREAKRVELFMDSIGQYEKTLVFCATEAHALAVRNLVNQMKPEDVTDTNYCCRVTASEGAIGDANLKTFQDNEKIVPTVLTTSRKLSTGVDALNVRHIVLMRTVNSMIEFKQIIGRGTRLFDGKNFFTIHDFVKAYEHFSDPEWDGEPVEPEQPKPRGERDGPGETLEEEPPMDEPPPRKQKIKVTLAPGKERLIDSMVQTSFWDPEGKPISADEFLRKLYGDLPALFQNEEQLRKLWGDPETRKSLLEGLVERGYTPQQLHDTMKLINAEQSDLYDVLAYIAFATTPTTRADRVATRLDRILDGLSDAQQTFLQFVLDHYVEDGVDELSLDKLPKLLELKYGGTADAANQLGGVSEIRQTFTSFQPTLYQPVSG